MSNDTIILHHYAFSPFGQKVRSMLGFADLPWMSVEVPPQPPRPSLDPMFTGYRKSPVAHIGADVFCDTRTIAAEIARIAGRPELSLDSLSEAELEHLDHMEGTIFAACLGALPKATMLWKLVTNLGFGLPKFLKDRAALGSAGGLDVPSAAAAAQTWEGHLDELNSSVSSGFLGGNGPSILDFSAYHVVWFFELMSDLSVTDQRPALGRWKLQMAAFGNGRPESITGERALAIARDSQPREVPSSTHPDLGKTVHVAPTDYGRDATEGVLVLSTAAEWVIARDTQACGRVHVHFPTRGYSIKRA